jgi:DNA segregation ATPase FtsK/SpoIIIE, S-DNA-T family
MNKYIECLYNLEKTFREEQSKLDMIEKDYLSETLPTNKYNERKKRIEKVRQDFQNNFQINITSLDNQIKFIRDKQPHLTHLNITKKSNFPDFIIFGRMKISHDSIKKDIFIPRVLPFPIEKVFYSYNMVSIKYIQQFILRILQISPLNKLELVLIDTLTLGESLKFIRGVLDNDFIYNQRILTYSDEIEESLRHTTDYLESLIQKQLVGYNCWSDFNKNNSKSILPLKVLVIIGVPEQFSSNSLMYLKRIIKFGPKVGILSLLIIEDNGKLKDIKDLLSEYGEDIEDIKLEFKEKIDILKFNDSLELLPSKEELTKLLNNINEFYSEESEIKSEINELWDKQNFWQLNSTDGIKIPIGWDKNQEKVYFEIGFESSEHHTLIGGRSGSGKSNLIHVMIQNISYFYSPDEVELFLLDYKEGVEFNSYVNPPLLNASLIAIHSDVNYGQTFLSYIVKEKNRRAQLFKDKNVKDFKEYRKSNNKLSRLIIIIDEFQVLFSIKNSKDIEDLFTEILRKGRSYGIHIILSTQTLKGVEANSISQLKSQIGNRLALVMSEEDSMSILSTQNTEASKLKGKPEVIYNNRGGIKEGNIKTFIPYASRENLNILLNLVNAQNYKKDINIYNGETLPSFPRDSKFQSNNYELLFGKEINFEESEFKIRFKKEIGNNLIISGRGKIEKQNILNTIFRNLFNNNKIKQIYYISQENDFEIHEDITIYDENIINQNLEENSFIIIDSFDGLNELHPKQGFGIQKEISLADKFKDIIEYGYKKNIYTIIFIDNFKRTNNKLRDFLNFFELRYGFNLNEENSTSLLSVSSTSKIKSISKNKAVFSNLITSEIVYFKPFKDADD